MRIVAAGHGRINIGDIWKTSQFGWDLPPGVSHRDIDRSGDPGEPRHEENVESLLYSDEFYQAIQEHIMDNVDQYPELSSVQDEQMIYSMAEKIAREYQPEEGEHYDESDNTYVIKVTSPSRPSLNIKMRNPQLD